jgi:hypothetical protein
LTLWRNDKSVAFAYSQARIPCSFSPQLVTITAELFCLQCVIMSDSISKWFYWFFIGSLNSKVEQCIELPSCRFVTGRVPAVRLGLVAFFGNVTGHGSFLW